MSRNLHASARLLLWALAVFAPLTVTMLAYWPGLAGPFLLDDQPNLTSAHLEHLDWADLVNTVFGNGSGPLGRPVSVLSLALTSYFHGLDSFYFKYENLAIHLITGLVLSWMTYYLLTAATTLRRERRWLIALVAAAIWLLHPLMVSTVLYAVQRMAQLSALFSALALLTYLKGRLLLTANDSSRGAVWMGLAMVLFTPLAVLSKENGVLLFPAFALLEWSLFRLRSAGPVSRRWLWLLLGAGVGLPLLLGAGYFAAHLDGYLQHYQQRDFTPQERLLTESEVLWFYVRLILLPRLADMSLYHDQYPIAHGLSAPVGLAIAALVLLVVVAVGIRRKAPLLSLGLLWFLLWHALESTIIPLELVFEHRNYLAAFGLILPLTYYAYLGLRRTPALGALVVVILGLLLTFQTTVRARTWGNQELLYRITLSDHPDSGRARSAYASFLFNKGRFAEGRALLRQAAAIYKDDAAPLIHLLATYCIERPAAIPPDLEPRARERLRKGHISAYTMGALFTVENLQSAGKCKAVSVDELVGLFQLASANRTMPRSYRYYAHLYTGRLLGRAGHHTQAIDELQAAVPLSAAVPPSKRPMALFDLAKNLIAASRFGEAAHAIEQLQRMNRSPLIDISDELKYLQVEDPRKHAEQ